MAEETKKTVKVIEGKAVVHKKGLGEKVHDAIVAVEFKQAASGAINDVIVPALKRTILETIYNTLNVMLFGKSSGNQKWFSNGLFGSSSTFSYSGPLINYSGISSGKPAVPTPTANIPTYDEIVLSSRADAEKVLDTLQAQLERFGNVAISDLYEAVGLPAISTYYNYGWKNLASASIGVVHDGYILKLPTAIPLNS